MKLFKKFKNKYKKFYKKNKKTIKFVLKVLVFLKASLEVVDVLLKLFELLGPILTSTLSQFGALDFTRECYS